MFILQLSNVYERGLSLTLEVLCPEMIIMIVLVSRSAISEDSRWRSWRRSGGEEGRGNKEERKRKTKKNDPTRMKEPEEFYMHGRKTSSANQRVNVSSTSLLRRGREKP